MTACQLRPTSRGRITLASADPQAAPLIDPQYLSTAEDERAVVRGLRLMRRIAEAPALASLIEESMLPKGEELPMESAALLEHAREYGESIYHPVGTCSMGPAADPNAVTSADGLRVHGVDGLRVVDASVMPAITSGNTNAATMMIAEKASDALLLAGAPGTQ